MADLADIDKQYNLLLDKYSPKDKATSKTTRVPKVNSDLKQYIDTALFAYDEYESGNIEDRDLVIQALRNGLFVANILINESIINSHIIENRERHNADTKQSLLLGQEREPKSLGGKKGRTHAHKEPLAIELFTRHAHKEINPLTGKKYTISGIYEELELSLGTGKEWRKNFKLSNGRTVYKS